MITAHSVNGRTMPERASRSPRRPVAPNADSIAMPATAGGRTSGSSTTVTSSARPRKRLVARKYAAGVPNSRIAALATSVVRAVTFSASRTTGSSSRPGILRSGISVNSATTGSARNTITTPAASASSAVNPARPAEVSRASPAGDTKLSAAAGRSPRRAADAGRAASGPC